MEGKTDTLKRSLLARSVINLFNLFQEPQSYEKNINSMMKPEERLSVCLAVSHLVQQTDPIVIKNVARTLNLLKDNPKDLKVEYNIYGNYRITEIADNNLVYKIVEIEKKKFEDIERELYPFDNDDSDCENIIEELDTIEEKSPNEELIKYWQNQIDQFYDFTRIESKDDKDKLKIDSIQTLWQHMLNSRNEPLKTIPYMKIPYSHRFYLFEPKDDEDKPKIDSIQALWRHMLNSGSEPSKPTQIKKISYQHLFYISAQKFLKKSQVSPMPLGINLKNLIEIALEEVLPLTYDKWLEKAERSCLFATKKHDNYHVSLTYLAFYLIAVVKSEANYENPYLFQDFGHLNSQELKFIDDVIAYVETQHLLDPWFDMVNEKKPWKERVDQKSKNNIRIKGEYDEKMVGISLIKPIGYVKPTITSNVGLDRQTA